MSSWKWPCASCDCPWLLEGEAFMGTHLGLDEIGPIFCLLCLKGSVDGFNQPNYLSTELL